MFFLADTTQKVDNNHRAIRFAYSCISSVIRFRFSKNAAISSSASRERHLF